MNGLIMNLPLTITSIMRHAEKVHADTEIVSVVADGSRHRYQFRDAFKRVRQLANALKQLDVEAGDMVATLAWNDYRHFELYYAISCSGAVCHTINPRLFPEQIDYIINHAEDKYVFLSPDFVGLLESLKDKLPTVKGFVVLANESDMPTTSLDNVICYETLIADQPDQFEWPEFDENTASSLCYTSGTTGNPKGVLYSHRSTLLHSYALSHPDCFNIAQREVIMPIVPMFHVNAWGIPYAAAMAGSKLVFPGSKMGDGATLASLINEEQVTVSAGVPTVWMALLDHLRDNQQTVKSLERLVVGGAACPLSVMEEFDQQHGVYLNAAWGMTEMSPIGTFNKPMAKMADWDAKSKAAVQLKAGRPVYGVEMKIVDENDNELPWDGVAFGSLKVRGPWICEDYFKAEKANDTHKDGWFDTGDIATIDSDAYLQITDRSKDVIKSGGEWISSIDIENVVMTHPQVKESAVVGLHHSKWSERPLLCVVAQSPDGVDEQELLSWLQGRIAKWWIPDAVVFVDELPHTATGKLDKKVIRKNYSDYRFPSDR